MHNELHRVFFHTIQDIYNSETQIVIALPKMIAFAQDPELKEALANHLDETREHVSRISQVCQMLGIETGRVTCQGTAGLVREADEQMNEFGTSAAGDAAIIANAQKVEHYEICNYGTVIEWAKALDLGSVRDILKQTIKEESRANEALTKIAERHVNDAAKEVAHTPAGSVRMM